MVSLKNSTSYKFVQLILLISSTLHGLYGGTLLSYGDRPQNSINQLILWVINITIPDVIYNDN